MVSFSSLQMLAFNSAVTWSCCSQASSTNKEITLMVSDRITLLCLATSWFTNLHELLSLQLLHIWNGDKIKKLALSIRAPFVFLSKYYVLRRKPTTPPCNYVNLLFLPGGWRRLLIFLMRKPFFAQQWDTQIRQPSSNHSLTAICQQ